MRKYIVIIFALLSFAPLRGAAQSGGDPIVEWSSAADALGEGVYTVKFTAKIAPDWHIYDTRSYTDGPIATSFAVELSPGARQIGEVVPLTRPIVRYEPGFGMEVGYYDGEAHFSLRVEAPEEGAFVRAAITWQACSDTQCMPPTESVLEVALGSGVPVQRPADAQVEGAAGNPVGNVVGTTAGSSAGGPFGSPLWPLVFAAILWAFAALLTPCVFPMIPITVSFFMKDGEGASRGRLRASMYGLFIVIIYTVPIALIILLTWLFGGAVVTANIFNWIATHWLPNLIFFIIFMVFAASFFGAFEITLPGRWVNRSDAGAERKGLGGIFFMALTLVLVSFACTGPIVSTVMIKATGGEFWAPIVVIFAFSVAFALPFTLLAFFPELLRKIPKSGAWLNSVKVVLGFIEVALGFKFLSVADQTYHWGILDREVYLAIWIVVFALLGFYLLGKIRFKHDAPSSHIGIGRLTLAIASLSFAVYLVPGMFGAPLKGVSGYLPPMETQDFVMGRGGADESADGGVARFINPITGEPPRHSDFLHLPLGLTGFFDIEEGSLYARSVGKPVFVNITGRSCVNCREMEMRVWSNPVVLELLRERFVIVALYLDDQKTLPQQYWVTAEDGKVLKMLGRINAEFTQRTYGTVAQPYYIIEDADGNLLVPPRGYDLSVAGFIGFLESGLEAYEQGRRNAPAPR